MVKAIISVDPKKAPWEQETPLHNRWHPDIPPVAQVKQGDKFREYGTFSLMCFFCVTALGV
jgi:formamidase